MHIRLTRSRVRLGLSLALLLPGLAFVSAQPRPRTKDVKHVKDVKEAKAPAKKYGWTNEQAIAQLAVHPRDPYLQYVALQTGRRESKLVPTQQQI